ncbi:hypothetical protein GCM10010300_79430 [Streptomyces olivaceoviridis]|nr:hypothetical protein GCM10010300_79430 [Streptomyces olivaceoviridis]
MAEPRPAKAVVGRLIDELVSRARAGGLQLTGEGGLLQQLAKRLPESALEGEGCPESWSLVGSGIDPVLVGPGGETDWQH